ncbi:MAG: hypothetical protein HY706_16105 [Candidatus Hydrogenedentes bacterium]|nr:hypothetical protein [Candidatus Hydrogenedentota bacterium]
MNLEEIDEIDQWLQKKPKLEDRQSRDSSTFTLKERFRRTMFYQDVPLRPNLEFGYWSKTLEVWREQGLPESVTDEASAYDYFGIENWAMVNLHANPLPLFKHEVLEENEERRVYRDELGVVAEVNKHGHQSIPHYLDYPIKDRETWEPFKAVLDPAAPERWKNFEKSVAELRNSTGPVGIFGGSLVGIPRNLIGFERIATMPYEDPDLLIEIINTFGHCIITMLEQALPHIQVDFAMGWEDICFNQGPIVPPEFFREVVGPWYRRISDVLVRHGCCVYTTDTDGNINPITDTFLENGLNTMFPVEVHAGSDPCHLRDKYGKRVRLWGGVDKRKLSDSKELIDKELQRLLPYVEQGGFIPTMDHRVPADIPLKNYLYYLDRKRELFNVGGEPKY